MRLHRPNCHHQRLLHRQFAPYCLVTCLQFDRLVQKRHADTAGNLYVCEVYQDVRKYPPGGGIGVIAAGVNGRGSAASQLSQPTSIFVDRQNNLYVLDGGNNRIQKFAPGDTAATTVAVVPNGALIEGLYVDCVGNIYLSDDANSAVIKFAPGASTSTVVAGGNGAGGAANQLNQPGYVWVDSAGNIFVSDGITYSISGNPRVMEWKPRASSGITVAGGHGYGYGHNQMTFLMWMDGKDNMYVENNNYDNGDGNIRVDSWPLGAGSGTTLLGNNGEGSALNQFGSVISGFTEDAKGNIYAADPNLERVMQYQRTVDIDTTYMPTASGQYYAVVTDIQGYTVTTPTITVNTPDANPASITITATATSTAVCIPITFTATTANAPSPNFQWEVSGVKVGSDSDSYSNNLFADGDQVFCILTTPYACSIGPGGDTSNIITLSIDPHGTAAYHTDSLSGSDIITCIITSDNVCGLAKSNSIRVLVSAIPSVAANQIFTIKYGDSLTLDPEITGNIISYLWTPGTGLSDSTIANPVADPTSTTDYKLTIVSAGCGADSGYILVNVYTPLALPNAFTPNGDGHNDVFYVLGGPVNSLVENFAVFNRFGAEIFHVHDVAPGDRTYAWNGAFHGTPAPAGTYVYLVVMKLASGTRQVYKGTVILIR